jgi:hypothetical protein
MILQQKESLSLFFLSSSCLGEKGVKIEVPFFFNVPKHYTIVCWFWGPVWVPVLWNTTQTGHHWSPMFMGVFFFGGGLLKKISVGWLVGWFWGLFWSHQFTQTPELAFSVVGSVPPVNPTSLKGQATFCPVATGLA